jgi:hypothetical protein
MIQEIRDLKEKIADAHRGISFSPDKRAEGYVLGFEQELEQDLEQLKEKNGSTGNYREKYIARVETWINRLSRCASPMITGPAGFNNCRNEKNWNSASNAWDDLQKWREKYIKRALAEKTKSPEEELDIALRDLDSQIANHEAMKVFNNLQ